MSPARYEFATDCDYVGRVVAARVEDRPGLGRMIRTVRLTLAVPVRLAPGSLLPSPAAEAQLWLLPEDEEDEEDDAAFLRVAGVTIDGDRYEPPAEAVYLKLRFGAPVVRSGFQPLEAFESYDGPIAPSLVPAPSVKPTGLEFPKGQGVVMWGGEKLKLSRLQVQILQALNERSPSPVSPVELKRAVRRWAGSRLGPLLQRSMASAMCELRKKLRDARVPLTIPDRDGDAGWVLIADGR